MATRIALFIGLLLTAAIIRVVARHFRSFKLQERARKAVAKMASMPSRVNLELEANPQWHNPRLINEYANQLRVLGFEDAGAFSVTELGGLMILGLVHPGEGLLSVVYDHRERPASFEICADYSDGTSVSATSNSIGGALDKRPNDPILWLGTTNAREILQAVQDHAASAPRKLILKDEFATHFKRAHARGMNWRLKKGGASREEIRRHAENSGKNLTEAQIEQCYQNLRAGYLKKLQSGCIAQYLDDQKPSADEWERIRSRTFAIAETLELKEIIDTISENVALDDEQLHELEKVEKAFGEDGVAVMGKILDRDIAGLELKKIGEVVEPVGAIILMAPAGSNLHQALRGLQPGLK